MGCSGASVRAEPSSASGVRGQVGLAGPGPVLWVWQLPCVCVSFSSEGLAAHQAAQQVVALGPVAQARLALMWPQSPVSSQALPQAEASACARSWLQYGSVRLPTSRLGNGRACMAMGLPGGQLVAQVGPIHIARSHQQSSLHAPGALADAGPGRHLDAAQAVRHQHHGVRAGQHGFFELDDPVAAQRAHPVVLLHALVTMQGFPAALPVVWPAVLPARQRQHRGGAACVSRETEESVSDMVLNGSIAMTGLAWRAQMVSPMHFSGDAAFQCVVRVSQERTRATISSAKATRPGCPWFAGQRPRRAGRSWGFSQAHCAG